MIIVDHALTTRFGTPLEYKNAMAVIMQLVKLITLEKGKNQLYPDMGVGLISRFRYMYEEDLPELENEIARQRDIYLPMYSDVSIKLSMEKSVLIISIGLLDLLVTLDINQESNQIRLVDVHKKGV